jgi:hypothetical protein
MHWKWARRSDQVVGVNTNNRKFAPSKRALIKLLFTGFLKLNKARIHYFKRPDSLKVLVAVKWRCRKPLE